MSIKLASEMHKELGQAALGAKFSIFTDDIARVTNDRAKSKPLTVKDRAPEFALPDANGTTVTLSALLASGPVVISFYMGEWCPFCSIELQGLQEKVSQIHALGARLVAISPEKPDHGLNAIEKNQLTFSVLSDFGNAVARKFGIVFKMSELAKEFSTEVFGSDIVARNGVLSYELPIPATYVIDPEGIIRFAHIDTDYMTGRAEPEDVVDAIRLLNAPGISR